MPSLIIVGYVWQFLGRVGLFAPPPHTWAAPKKLILNRVKMVVTVMKTNFRKLEPKIINYRNYRYFSNDRFREKVTSELSKVVLENSDKGFNRFLDVCKQGRCPWCKEALNMYAPVKKKYIRGNNSPFINRILSKEIMKR